MEEGSHWWGRGIWKTNGPFNKLSWWTGCIAICYLHSPQMEALMLLCISIRRSHTQSPVTPAVCSMVFKSSVSQHIPSCSPGIYTSTPLFLMALESSPCRGSMVRNSLQSHKHQLSIFNVFNKGQQVIIFQYYLKLWCGVILGVFPSMTPRSLMMRDPPGSRRALRRSSTEALRREHTIHLCICTSTTELLRFLTLPFNSKCYLTPSQRIGSFKKLKLKNKQILNTCKYSTFKNSKF